MSIMEESSKVNCYGCFCWRDKGICKEEGGAGMLFLILSGSACSAGCGYDVYVYILYNLLESWQLASGHWPMTKTKYKYKERQQCVGKN
jgi:hypothetical protein